VTDDTPRRPGGDDQHDDQPWDLDAEAWSELLSGPGRAVPVGAPAREAPDLTTTYLGFELRSPLVASASPLTGDVTALRTIDAAGVGAVVLPSLFEEQVEHELGQLESLGREEDGLNPEAATGYRPRLDGYNAGAVRYLDLLRRARAAVSVPVIASLNGATPGGWLRFSLALEDAGADAIELNVMQVVADASLTGREVESETLSVVESVARTCDLPVAVKLSPAWSSLPSFARRLVDAGAAGLVLFGRAPHLEVDATTLGVRPVFGLSRPEERAEPLRWTAILRGQVDASLAASGGVRSGRDAAELLLVGADVVMVTSVLLEQGPGHLELLGEDLSAWLQGRGYRDVAAARGLLSQERVVDRTAFQRSQYLTGLTSYANTFRT
jgi:dihydroorotate dehydrogenase (fumarate)